VESLTALVDAKADEARIINEGGALLQALVAHDDWLPDACAQADPQHYRQYLLYLDPGKRFSVLSFVWGPGQSTPIHDHTVWGMIGMLRGAEVTQAYRRSGDGPLQAQGAPQRLERGSLTAVSPTLGDIHQVANAFDDQVSIGIHVYGADIGAVDRSVFTEQGLVKPFRSGYANARSP
jgi:predicted metal-dependent enzyme (double-stranded beta helix superfamily)